MDDQEITMSLKRKGYRASKLRSALLKVLNTDQSALSVPELISKVTTFGLKTNKTSVYRSVANLLKEGVVEEVSTSFGPVSYKRVKNHSHHHHLVCTNCKATICLDLPKLETEIAVASQNMAAQQGFQLLTHEVTFYGRCLACTRK